MPFDGFYETDKVSVLKHAKDLVAKGWCQDSFKIYADGNSKAYCIIGAYRQAFLDAHPELGMTAAHQQADSMFLHLFLNELGVRFVLGGSDCVKRLADYNDRPWRRHASVLKLYTRVIGRLAAKPR